MIIIVIEQYTVLNCSWKIHCQIKDDVDVFTFTGGPA